MRATLEYIKQKFDEYNNLMFEGKLKPLPFKLSNAKSFLGAVFFQREKNPDDTWHYYGFVFKISTVMDLPEDVVEDTIIHEMIHYYIMSNQMQDTAPHGKLFIAKMQEINRKFNRNLSVTHRTTKEEQDSDKRVQQHIICVSRLKTGKRGVTVATKSRLFELWDAMPNIPKMAELKWMISTDPYFNRFPKATKPGIYFVPSEELEPHLKDAKELIKQGNSIRIKKWYDHQRKNKQKLKLWGLTVEDLTEEELAEAKECLKPGTIDGFFSSEVLIKKSLLKSIERKKIKHLN